LASLVPIRAKTGLAFALVQPLGGFAMPHCPPPRDLNAATGHSAVCEWMADTSALT